jgi:hypothetical protein
MPTAACEDLEARTSEYCVQSFYSRIKNLMGGITTVRENTLIYRWQCLALLLFATFTMKAAV